MMPTLDTRLQSALNDLATKYNQVISHDVRLALIDGITVGYHKDNTFDSAVAKMESRLLVLIQGDQAPQAV